MDDLIVRCATCGTQNRIAEARHSTGTKAVCGKCGTSLRAQPVNVTDRSFHGVVENSRVPVLVDLWAPWCGPCRMMAPVLDELATELEGRFLVAKVNTDENPATARRFAVQSIPTLLVIDKGREVSRMVGGHSKGAILQRLREVL